MVVLGLVLLVLCLVVGAGVALSNTDAATAEAFGVSLSGVSIGGLFLLGTAVGALAMLGAGLMLVGAARKRARKVAHKREVQSAREEQESLAEENARLQAELDRTGSASADRTTGVERAGDDLYPQDDSAQTDEVRGKHGR